MQTCCDATLLAQTTQAQTHAQKYNMWARADTHTQESVYTVECYHNGRCYLYTSTFSLTSILSTDVLPFHIRGDRVVMSHLVPSLFSSNVKKWGGPAFMAAHYRAVLQRLLRYGSRSSGLHSRFVSYHCVRTPGFSETKRMLFLKKKNRDTHWRYRSHTCSCNTSRLSLKHTPADFT